MKSIIHHHNWDQLEKTPRVLTLLREIEKVVSEAPVFLWPNKTSTTGEHQNQCILQSVLNLWFRAAFADRGWTPELPVKPKEMARHANYKVDFGKSAGHRFCMLEVEFGNVARLDCDQRKFADAYHWGRLEFGVILVAQRAMGMRITDSPASFENVLNDLNSAHPKTVPYPLMVVGLDHRDSRIIDMSQSLIPCAKDLSGNSPKEALRHVVAQIRAGVPVEKIGMPC